MMVRGKRDNCTAADVVCGNRALDLTDKDVLRVLCTGVGCRRDSLGNAVANAARMPAYTRIATGASSWVDDFMAWLRAGGGDAGRACCRRAVEGDGSDGPICPVHWTPALHPGRDLPKECACNATLEYASPACPSPPCAVAGGCLSPSLPDSAFQKYNATSGDGQCWGVRLAALCPQGGEHPFCGKMCYAKYTNAVRACTAGTPGLPQGYQELFSSFIDSECPSSPSDSAQCGVCGAHYVADLGGYARLVTALHGDAVPASLNINLSSISASRHMAYHSPLVTQEDFIAAVDAAYRLASDISDTLMLDIAPYSPFYVFFEQYITIQGCAAIASLAALGAVFLSVMLLLGTLRGATLVLATAGGILVTMVGCMAIAQVRLNALSTVNLVAAVGISVEFTVHVLHGFMCAAGTKAERAVAAVRGVGGVVLSGIVVTKLLGVAVLSLAKSKIFVVYYFRMYVR
jgi:hypothetical protein